MDEPIITASQQRPTDSKQELERQFAVFAVLWSLAVLLVTCFRFDAGLNGPWFLFMHAAVCLAAVTQLFRPTWAIPCALLGALQVVYGLVRMPFISTTDVMWLFFGGAICISYLSNSIAHRSFVVSPVGLFRSFAPCLRIVLVVSLASLSVARLNWAFVRLDTSPVVATLSQIRGDTSVPDWVAYLTISMLLVVDLFLVVALLIPSLRRFAVGIGGCYFAWQALLGFGEARLMLPLVLVGLYLFTSTGLVNRIYAAMERWIPISAIRRASILVVTVLALTGVIALSFSSGNGSRLTSQRLVAASYALFVLIWLLVQITNLIDGRPRLTWISFMLRSPAHYGWIGTLIVVAASPYVGLGTRGRFSDFSGLQSHGGRNNHLFVAQACLTGYSGDVVEIVGSSDAYLDRLAQQGKLLTWFDLVNYLNQRPDTSLTFIRGGEQFAVDRAGDIAEFSTENHWLHRKLISYRPIEHDFVADQVARVVGVN